MGYCENCGFRVNAQWKYCTNCGTRIKQQNYTTKSKSTIIDKDGYRRFKDSNRLLHRYVAEKSIGRKLRKGETVHHKNLKKLDNRPENLMIFPNQLAHKKFHDNLDHSKCPECGNYLRKIKGKYGEFWGCTDYPYCDYTRPLPTG
ncbi:MAG: topoisomerase DNA-binding C4 zinc finger domain-containing protein [Candidatus Hodarchaeales archaeon]